MKTIQILTLVLLSTYFLCLIARLFLDEQKKLKAAYFIIISFSIIALVASLRTNIGDTYVYVQTYKNFNGLTFVEAMKNKGDWGFFAFTYLLNRISTNEQFMIFVTAFITQFLYLKFFLKYRSYLELEIFIYITSGYYYVTMNGIRQAFAAGFVLFSTKYIIEGKTKKFMFCTLLTSLLHQSALIMIPIYFIVRSKPWTKKIFFMCGLAVVGTILFYELLPILEKLLEGSNFEHYIKIFKEGTEQGANSLRVLVSLVPVGLAYLNRKNMEDNMFNRVFINISVINAIFMTFALRTWIFARFTMYFSLYNCVFIPYLIYNWKNKKEKNLLYGVLILCYFIFFAREHMGAEAIKFYSFG